MTSIDKRTSPGCLSTVATVGVKEFRDCVRGRWLGVAAILFALLSLAIVYGTAAIGGNLDFRPLNVVMNSLVSLTVFLLPLVAFMISYDAFVGEAESGTLLLMLTYPLNRLEWLMGKAIGQSAALLIALILGYLPLVGLTAGKLLPYELTTLLVDLSGMLLSAWILGVIAIFIAYLVSLSVSSKNRALGMLLLIWLIFVLLYDLGLLVLSIAASDSIGREVMQMCLLANPASVFRMINQDSLGITSFGFSPLILYGILLAWIIVLFVLDYWCLVRRRL